MFYDKNNANGIILLGVDLAIIEKYEGEHQAIIWGNSDSEDYT